MKALVTGGGGFLGKAIVKLLRERGEEVRSFSRNPHPVLIDIHGGPESQGRTIAEPTFGEAVLGSPAVANDALFAGVSVNQDGQPEASMGVDAGHFDGERGLRELSHNPLHLTLLTVLWEM